MLSFAGTCHRFSIKFDINLVNLVAIENFFIVKINDPFHKTNNFTTFTMVIVHGYIGYMVTYKTEVKHRENTSSNEVYYTVIYLVIYNQWACKRKQMHNGRRIGILVIAVT